LASRFVDVGEWHGFNSSLGEKSLCFNDESLASRATADELSIDDLCRGS
jgi:hypothetical protein